MKQNVVIKVSMNGKKSRTKAMRIAVGVPGVESAALKGQDKDQIEVVGDGMDAVALTSLLRKNVGHAELMSVKEVPAKKDGGGGGGGGDGKKSETTAQLPPWFQMGVPHYPVYQVVDYPSHDPLCSIM